MTASFPPLPPEERAEIETLIDEAMDTELILDPWGTPNDESLG